MRTILVATDRTADGENAVFRAIQLSKLSGAKLHVLHVARSSQVPEKSDQTELFDAEVSDQIRRFSGQYVASSDVEYEVHIESRGRVYEKVVEYARKLRADLVVIGRSARPDVLPDSVFLTTGQVITNSPAPVLVVTQPGSGSYRNILLETHLSMGPEEVLTPVRYFGPDIRLTLLINPPFRSQTSAGIVQRLITAFRRRKCDKYMTRAANLLGIRGAPGNRLSLAVVEDDYEAVLRSKLKDKEIDVVGFVRMHRKLGNQDPGSNFLTELQTASCDVLTRSH